MIIITTKLLMITSTVKVGVPDVTCLIYEAKDGGPVEDCTKPDINLCRSISRSQPFLLSGQLAQRKYTFTISRDCTWPPPEVGEKPNCWAKKNFTRSSMIEMKIIICPMLAIESID